MEYKKKKGFWLIFNDNFIPIDIANCNINILIKNNLMLFNI